MTIKHLISTLLLSAFLVSCGTTTAGGSGTGTGNPVVVAGVAYNQDGSVASGAFVRVRSTGKTAADTSYSYLGEEFDAQGVALCDDSGAFAVSLVENGEFLIEVRDSSGEVSHVDPLFVTDDVDSIEVKNILLLSLDTLRGSISLHGGTAGATVQVYAYGTDYVVPVQSDGSYEIALPRGVYNVNVVPDNDEFPPYRILDVNSLDSLPELMMLAIEPISNSYTTDSLIVRSILDHNGLQGIRVEQVSWRDSVTGRIIELDFEPDVEDSSAINISGYLTYIPSSVAGLLALEQLEIQFSSLTEIPAEIGTLPNLKVLELNYNEFTELPVELANLTGLTFLDLAGNHLESLPEPLKSWADTYDPDWATTQQ